MSTGAGLPSPATRWVLDTNVVSELMRDAPDQRVTAWLDRQPQPSLYISAVTIMEIRSGLDRMPPSNRRNALESAFSMVVKDDFAGRVLPLDQSAAEAAGRIDADRSKSGRPVGDRDTMISGIATSNGFGVVTRNVSDFHSLDVPVFNPFLAPL